MTRQYVVCCHPQCSAWLWADRAAKHHTCSKCGTAWSQSVAATGGRAVAEQRWPSLWQAAQWREPKPRRQKPTPPPGLSGGTRVEAGVLAAIHKHWSTLDAKLQEELTAQGLQVKPPQKEAGDLQEACRQHLASLPESVRKLVQEPKQEPTYGEAVSDLNKKFKLETSQLRDLVQQSITLQERIDKAKQSYEELLRSMQALTEKLQTKQAEVEALQKQLQSKLSESDVPPAKPEEGQTFDAFFAALEKAGLQLDEAQRNKVREQLAEPPHLEVQVKKRRLEEGTGEEPGENMQQG